eukprot:NODE_4379_length_680_cov_298.249600.p1 GENE.NODE_4379_length_680_cov_298.249600~~NODE_4379_length_680_cov_298.249600.p1  ORF type:complete len:182 (-),score=54.95 NODE_4379_length_680_cov_298.249600:122-589(-)
MMRVKDGAKSKWFYNDIMGMDVLREMVIPGDFTNFFLASLNEAEQSLKVEDVRSAEAREIPKRIFRPALELTHNHGTENDESFAVHTGNTEPQGFGHIGFLVDNLEAMCAELEAAGVSFEKRPHEGTMRGYAIVTDPSGYRVGLTQRGVRFPAAL